LVIALTWINEEEQHLVRKYDQLIDFLVVKEHLLKSCLEEVETIPIPHESHIKIPNPSSPTFKKLTVILPA